MHNGEPQPEDAVDIPYSHPPDVFVQIERAADEELIRNVPMMTKILNEIKGTFSILF